MPAIRPLSWLCAVLVLYLVGGLPLAGIFPAWAATLQPLLSAASAESRPVVFVPNRGQSPASVLFQADFPGGGAFFTQRGFVFSVPAGSNELAIVSKLPTTRAVRMELRFVGSNPQPSVTGLERLVEKRSYILGSDPSQWVHDLPTYGAIIYQDLYPGIDLHIAARRSPGVTTGHIKGTYLVTPGADPGAIRWRYVGASRIRIDHAGRLRIGYETRPSGSNDPSLPAFEAAPLAWQATGNREVTISAAYHVHPDGSLGIDVGDYDPLLPLIIDPTLTFSTILGGTSYDEGYAVAMNSARNVYLLGTTFSPDFPGAAAMRSELEGNRNIIVARLARDGVGLEYSLIIGGSDEDVGRDIAVDPIGDFFITGHTASPDFPATIPSQTTEDGEDNVFVAKISASGGQIRYSRVIGGSAADRGHGIAVDAAGQAFVVGATSSMDFPTASPLQPVPMGGGMDAFILKMNATGSQLVYSSYLGGSFNDAGYAVDVDRQGSAFVAGLTDSDDFPVHEAIQDQLQGFQDAFVAKLTPDGGGFLYSTYLGEGQSSVVNDIHLDRDGSLYLVGTASYGETGSEDSTDVFAIRLDPPGAAKMFSTRLGGRGDDEGYGISLDRDGNVYLTGKTESPDLPVDGSLQSGYGGNGDAFIAQLAPGGEPVTYNYLGGAAFDAGYDILVDNSGDAVVAGLTFSPDFPTVSPLQAAFGGDGDAFVLKIGDIEFIPTPVPTGTAIPTALPPTPTLVPSTGNQLVQSDLFLYGLIALIGLVAILGAVELGRLNRK